jgi:F-type H+-transporting ATPase subunit epsilon
MAKRCFDDRADGATISPLFTFRSQDVAFHCDIVTPDHEVFKQSVSSVVLPAHDGYLGILTNRAPLLVRLGSGLLTATLAGGGSKAFQVRGGVAQMKDNRLTVLTEAADESTPV